MAPTLSVFQPVDSVLQMMITALQGAGSKITDFTTGSTTRTLFEAEAAVISNNTAVADQLQNDSYLDTATGDALDALASSNWFVARNPAVQASGQITITRQSTAGAMLLPAGWSQLVTSPAVAGQTGVAVLTTQDASFGVGVASVTVGAQAVIGGSAGNLNAGTFLTPLAPVNGVSSQTGFEVTTAFTNGVDQETDDAYRARVPVTVQGRAPGKPVSFLAAALGVPGVLSANVLTPGLLRGDGSAVPVNTIEVYYQGSSGLLSQVQSAVTAAATGTQTATAYASASLTAPRGPQRVVAHVAVWCQPGTDTTALGVAVANALQTYVNGVGVGNTAYLALAIDAILQTQGVVSAAIPPAQFSLFGGSGAADIPMAGDSYPSLAAADITVTVNVL